MGLQPGHVHHLVQKSFSRRELRGLGGKIPGRGPSSGSQSKASEFLPLGELFSSQFGESNPQDLTESRDASRFFTLTGRDLPIDGA